MSYKEIQRSRLLQKLQSPRHDKDACGTFGIGLTRGGMRHKASKIFGQIFSFDYMGNSEFEGGVIGRTLQAVYDEKNKLAASSLTIPVRMRDSWSGEIKEGDAVFYIIQTRKLQGAGHVEGFLRGILDGVAHTAEPMDLMRALFPKHDEKKTLGWLELDNGYFIFVDHKAFVDTAKLFGVGHAIAEPARDIPTVPAPKVTGAAPAVPKVA